jgi:hypothetical protein
MSMVGPSELFDRSGASTPVRTTTSPSNAAYFAKLATEGAVFERIYGEEHHSQGNYFWLFSGSNTTAVVGANRSCGAASPRS